MVVYPKEAEVNALLPVGLAIECVERAFRGRAHGLAHDVPRERTRTPAGTLHVLQAASTAINTVGFKAYYPCRSSRYFLVHLLDLDTGHLRAMIEADEMGICRTAAATAVATRALSRPDASVVACFGSGRHAMAQLRAVAAVRTLREVRVCGRTPEHLETFRQAAQAELGIPVALAASPAAALDGADIVNIVTRSSVPLLAGALLQQGQHVNAVGSNALDRREVDLEAVTRATVVVDSTEVARRECGDLLPAIERGLLHWNTVPELGDVLVGRSPSRRGGRDITLFESRGLGLQDIYVGRAVLDAALAAGMGIELPI